MSLAISKMGQGLKVKAQSLQIKRNEEIFNLLESIRVDSWQEVNVNSVEQSVDGDVIAFGAFCNVTGKAKDEFASHGLRAIHSTEKCHICLRKKNIVKTILS